MFYSTTGKPEVANFFDRAQAGDGPSLDRLMAEHEGLVHRVLRACENIPLGCVTGKE